MSDRVSRLELGAEERAALSRLAHISETRVARKVLVSILWRLRESCDSCTPQELPRIQGAIMALKDVVSTISEEGEGNDE